jgi:hypothetical protein
MIDIEWDNIELYIVDHNTVDYEYKWEWERGRDIFLKNWYKYYGH